MLKNINLKISETGEQSLIHLCETKRKMLASATLRVPSASWACESLEILGAEGEALWSFRGVSVQLFKVSDPTALGIK